MSARQAPGGAQPSTPTGQAAAGRHEEGGEATPLPSGTAPTASYNASRPPPRTSFAGVAARGHSITELRAAELEAAAAEGPDERDSGAVARVRTRSKASLKAVSTAAPASARARACVRIGGGMGLQTSGWRAGGARSAASVVHLSGRGQGGGGGGKLGRSTMCLPWLHLLCSCCTRRVGTSSFESRWRRRSSRQRCWRSDPWAITRCGGCANVAASWRAWVFKICDSIVWGQVEVWKVDAMVAHSAALAGLPVVGTCGPQPQMVHTLRALCLAAVWRTSFCGRPRPHLCRIVTSQSL